MPVHNLRQLTQLCCFSLVWVWMLRGGTGDNGTDLFHDFSGRRNLRTLTLNLRMI